MSQLRSFLLSSVSLGRALPTAQRRTGTIENVAENLVLETMIPDTSSGYWGASNTLNPLESALQLIGVSTTTTNSPTDGSLSLPVGAAAGDFAVIYGVGSYDRPVVSPFFDIPYVAGWTQEGRISYSTSNDATLQSHSLSSGDIGATSITVPGTPGYNENIYLMWVFRASYPLAINATNHDESNGFTDPDSVLQLPGLTTTVADTIIVRATGGRPQGSSWTAKPDLTEDFSIIGSLESAWAGHSSQAAVGTSANMSVTNAGIAYKGSVSWTFAVGQAP